MAEIEILVAPNGVGVPEELQHTAPNLAMLLSLAGVVGALVRQTSKVTEPIHVRVQVARDDDVGLVWVAGPFVLHASDLRAGTLSQYCEMVRKSRAKAGLAAMILPTPGVTVPGHVMSLCAADEGIPVGIIVQCTASPVPLPLLDVGLERSVMTMWLVSVYCNIIARLGEPALRSAIAATAALRSSVAGDSELVDRLPGTLKPHKIADDEAVAFLVLEEWEREGGAAAIRAFTALVAP